MIQDVFCPHFWRKGENWSFGGARACLLALERRHVLPLRNVFAREEDVERGSCPQIGARRPFSTGMLRR